MLDESRITEWLVLWEAAKDSGSLLTAEDLCTDQPADREELRRRIRLLRIVDRILDLSDCLDSPDAADTAIGRNPVLVPPEYEILGELGCGGMGVVYLARHTLLKRAVALKVLRPGLGASPPRVRRFIREAQALARLRHENIVPIFDARFHAGEFYFAMEFLRGGTVARQLERFAQCPATAAVLAERVARALHHAHEQGILHRDLKPANILLDEMGHPFVVDFGLARFLDVDGPDSTPGEDGPEPVASMAETQRAPLTWAGVQPGTPPYMAPEQFDASFGPVTIRTDVWAMGVILYELLTRYRPFDGKDVSAIGRAVCEQTPAPARTRRRDLDPRLDAIIGKCLEKDPAKRYATAGDLADDLARWRRAEPVLVYPEGVTRSVVRRLRRHPTVATAIVLLCALAAMMPILLRPAAAPSPVPAPSPAENADVKAEGEYRRAVAGLETELAEGRAIELVDVIRGPLAHRLRIGDAKVQTAPEGSGAGPVLIAGRAMSMLELFPSPPRDAYKLKIQLRHENAFGKSSQLGVYVALETQAHSAGAQHFFVRLVFSDLGERAVVFKDRPGRNGSQVQLGLSYAGASPDSLFKTDFSQAPNLFYLPDDPLTPPGPWRDLTIEVRPRSIQAWWGNEAVGQIPANNLEGWYAGFDVDHPDLRGIEPRERFRGAMGVYLNDASMSLRRFSIEPLRE